MQLLMSTMYLAVPKLI